MKTINQNLLKLYAIYGLCLVAYLLIIAGVAVDISADSTASPLRPVYQPNSMQYQQATIDGLESLINTQGGQR